jgi:hypothetical protein
MVETKLRMCWQYWKMLSNDQKESGIAKHLRCACECGVKLIEERDALAAECQRLRLKYEGQL